MKLGDTITMVSDQTKVEVHYGSHVLNIQEIMACQNNEVKFMSVRDNTLYINLVSMARAQD